MKQLQSTRIILVRHGRTKDNERRVFQGQKGGPLDDVGQRQAVLAAGRLGNKEIDAVYASDLIRASETARILATPHGLVAELDPRLREVDVGGWSGLGTDEIRVQFPEEYSAWNRGDDVRRGGGESYADVAIRMEQAIDERVKLTPRTTMLFVSHGGAIRAYVARVTGCPLPALGAVANTGISVLERSSKGARLVVYNDTARLGDVALKT